MFDGTEDDLKQTNVTQPAIFLHSVILARYWVMILNPIWLPVIHLVNFLPWWLIKPYRLKMD